MKLSSIICASIVALSVFTLTAVGQVRQQFNVPPGVQAVKPNDTTLPERVNALQAEVNQLVAEINSLKNQLASVQKDTVAANLKSAAAVLWINNNGELSKQAGIWVNANMGLVADIITKYPSHTHMVQYGVYTDPGNYQTITGIPGTVPKSGKQN